MTTYRTKEDCGCPPVITGTGQKKPDECRCGNPYFTEKQLQPKTRKRSTRRSEPRRDWTLANAKRDEEEDICRVTGEHGTELAHVMGRKYDEPISPGSRTLLVLPDRVVPLAPRIHTAYDAHDFDLLPYLTTSEQAQAVLDAGSIGLALKRISPVAAREMAA